MIIARPIPGWIPSTPPIVGESELSTLGERTTIAVHFWAPWNGIDPPFDELIRQLSDRFASRVRFYSANIDLEENRGLCDQCQVINIPVLSIRVNGVWQQPIIGCRATAEELATEIEARLGGQRPLARNSEAWIWLASFGILIAGAVVFVLALAGSFILFLPLPLAPLVCSATITGSCALLLWRLDQHRAAMLLCLLLTAPCLLAAGLLLALWWP